MGLLVLVAAAVVQVAGRLPDDGRELGAFSTTTAFSVQPVIPGREPDRRAAGVSAPTGSAPSPPARPAAPPTGPPSTALVPPTVAATGITVPGPPVTRDGALSATTAAINAGGVRFAYRDATLDAAAVALLDRLAAALPPDAGRVLVLRGHTDATGDEAGNHELARCRAQAMADHLVAEGVPASRLVVVPVGDDEPVGDNGTEAGRAANRRGEVLLSVAP